MHRFIQGNESINPRYPFKMDELIDGVVSLNTIPPTGDLSRSLFEIIVRQTHPFLVNSFVVLCHSISLMYYEIKNISIQR